MKKPKAIKIQHRFRTPKGFVKWTKKERLDWYDKKVESLLKRLSKLKKELPLYDDKSFELYNQSRESLEIMIKAFRKDVEKGVKPDKSYKKFLNDLLFYNKPPKKIKMLLTNRRMDEFIEYARATMEESEFESLMSLIDMMSEEDKYQFTRSKYFFSFNGLQSAGLAEFEEIYGMSLQHVRLELFMAEKYDIDKSQTTYYRKRKELGFEE